ALGLYDEGGWLRRSCARPGDRSDRQGGEDYRCRRSEGSEGAKRGDGQGDAIVADRDRSSSEGELGVPGGQHRAGNEGWSPHGRGDIAAREHIQKDNRKARLRAPCAPTYPESEGHDKGRGRYLLLSAGRAIAGA